jgi:hypothetical protein
MGENWKRPINFDGILPRRILTGCVEEFMGYMEKFIYSFM